MNLVLDNMGFIAGSILHSHVSAPILIEEQGRINPP